MSGSPPPPGSILKQDSMPYEVHKNRHLLATDVPDDAPKMVVRWHYAVDVPKRRLYEKPGVKAKAPTNFVAFSARDSKSLEDVWNSAKPDEPLPKVPVNEDHLFEADVEERELGPIYWRGPVYEIRRGSWHFAEGGVLKPCEENLATQVEEGYLKVKPFRDSDSTASGTATPVSNRAEDLSTSSRYKLPDVSKDSRLLATPDGPNKEDLARRKSLTDKSSSTSATPDLKAESKRNAHRDHMRPLFGAYAGRYVLYTGKTTAWLLSDDLYGKISSSFLQSITRGVHMGGQKLRRGYADPEPAPVETDRSAEATNPVTSEDDTLSNVSPSVESVTPSVSVSKAAKEADAGTGTAPANQTSTEAEFDLTGTDNPDRKIEHLILCCHGIGQKLGERMESVNFVHDVNVLRRNFKKTFMHSRDLQTLSSERTNCGIQVLPVEWRQNIQFGMSKDYEESVSQKTEKDLSNALEDEDNEHATLEDITIEGVQTIRNLVSDVLLDILLYYQPAYREKIVRAVSREMNRVYALFKKNHPSFNGRVSILGHSLGSAIAFDILCRQPTDPGEGSIPKEVKLDVNLALNFSVENFYAVGSPIGLFQMLRGKNIAARSQLTSTHIPFSPLGNQADPFDQTPISFPKLQNFYNIFHPSDPVSYRVEPLVSKHTAKLKPYPMTYTKAGFRQQLVGLSSIPQRAYEGASSYWSALRSSITNSIVSRSLGYGDLSSPAGSSRAEIENEKQKIANEINKQHEETLFAGFEKAWGSNHSKKTEGEQKLRALNRAGRIDYAIQEDMFGSSYMSAISAHLAYWSDPDLSYFILSYILLHDTPAESETAGQESSSRMKPTRLTTDL